MSIFFATALPGRFAAFANAKIVANQAAATCPDVGHII
jgi:hypothetical protein